MTPAQVHIHLLLLFKAGKVPSNTVGDPGAQGATVTGMQGMGVSTPRAAVVAAATVGLAREVHMPKGRMFTMGAKSIMLAASGPPAIVGAPFGITINELGATPKEHCNVAPITTCIPMIDYPLPLVLAGGGTPPLRFLGFGVLPRGRGNPAPTVSWIWPILEFPNSSIDFHDAPLNFGHAATLNIHHGPLYFGLGGGLYRHLHTTNFNARLADFDGISADF